MPSRTIHGSHITLTDICLFFIMPLVWVHNVTAVSPTPHLPACYKALGSSANIPKAYQPCQTFCGPPGYALYCATDHYCSFDESSCPVCKLSRSSLSRSEIIGVVIGTAIFGIVFVSVAIFIAQKHAKK